MDERVRLARAERYAELRELYPDVSDAEIENRIMNEEIDEAEAAECRRIAACVCDFS